MTGSTARQTGKHPSRWAGKEVLEAKRVDAIERTTQPGSAAVNTNQASQAHNAPDVNTLSTPQDHPKPP